MRYGKKPHNFLSCEVDSLGGLIPPQEQFKIKEMTDNKIDFLPSNSAACCSTETSKVMLEGCASGVSYVVLICDSDCGATTSMKYLNTATGLTSSTPPAGFMLGNCSDKTDKVACVPYYETETFDASAGQTTFTLANIAQGDVRFSRNGATLRDGAATVSGSVVTYVPSSNNGEVLLANDRIEISYIYVVCDVAVEPFVDCAGNEIGNGAALVTCASLDLTDFNIDPLTGKITIDQNAGLKDCIGNDMASNAGIVSCDKLDPDQFTIDPVTGEITVTKEGVVIQSKDCITITGSGTVADPYIIGSSSCGGSTDTCPTFYKDVVALPASGSVVIYHNLDLADPYAFLFSHYNLGTGLPLSVDITNVTSNSFTLENNSTTFALNYLVNVQKNEPCDAVPSLNCDYQYIDVVNGVKTLSSGATATVSGSTGDDFKTFQGNTGWNLGDLEDNEKITTVFSVPMKKVRILFDTCERLGGAYEQVKVFLNGAPYAIQASELTSPINSGGKFNIIDGGFTLDPVSGSDDASGIVVIDYPAGITSIAVQDIKVSGGPNGALARLEVKECI
jgi:hypothetical protein